MVGVVGYLYSSVTDAIKESKLPFEFRQTLMAIGRLVYLSDEDFDKRLASDSLQKINAQDIQEAFQGD